jgi:PAS domain S-box-containing protein
MGEISSILVGKRKTRSQEGQVMDRPDRNRGVTESEALRAIVAGTASETGQDFYEALVGNLARTLGTHGAWITEYDPQQNRLRTLAFWLDGQWVRDYVYPVAGTPCETAIRETRLVHIPDRILDLYPDQPAELRERGIVSYLGVPLLGEDRSILGHVAVVDNRPISKDERILALFRIFANRAVAEMRRLALERELRDGREQLGRLIGSAMDAIVEMDHNLNVTMMNAAAEKIFGCRDDQMRGERVERLIGSRAMRRLTSLADELDRRTEGEPHLWIAGGLTARTCDGKSFPAEATLSRYEMHAKSYFTLILRDVNERIAAERQIRSLSAQAEYLRQEIECDHAFDEILGNSPSLGMALRAVEQVARKRTSVLILGETGTGKELFARAIHRNSTRRSQPLIKVNCAAIPANLIESEFFGHERGAFTGATRRRDGRFALADGGTIFLDEIGELPLELQGKLLRVLQEGEFERVGSSKMNKVDVRVLAATNRDLQLMVERGEFRGDLFFRLNVFPIRIPPLRERGDDVVLLAETIIAKLAREFGTEVGPLCEADRVALRGYEWPGNVRELRNVLERAVITSGATGRLHLERALPETGETGASSGATSAAGGASSTEAVLTVRALRELERQNLIRALERTDWRVGGEQGAARLLGMNASTLKSRIKALGIRRG